MFLLFLVVLVCCSPETGGDISGNVICNRTETNRQVTVATYNIHGGIGRDGKRDLERIAETLRGADFVGLQEVDNGRVRSAFENQARSLATTLGHRYWQHFPAEDYWPLGTYGIAASSSLPIVASGVFDLPIVEKRPLRRLAWIKFLSDCRPIHVFLIHATHGGGADASAQAVQVESAWRVIVDKTDAAGEPVIFMGDFNAASTSRVIRWLRERMIDVVEGQAPQLPAVAPLDHIFVRGDLAILNVDIRDSGASDHPAIVATLQRK